MSEHPLVKFDPVNKMWIQHATAQQIREYYATQEQWKSYFKFSFVRNPFDRLVSSYISISKYHKFPLNKLGFRDFVFKEGKYKELLDPATSSESESRFHHLVPAVDYLFEKDKLLVDFVGKFENLAEDWKFVCKKLGAKLTLPHANKRDHWPYRTHYDEETRELVAKLYKKDLELFGYEF